MAVHLGHVGDGMPEASHARGGLLGGPPRRLREGNSAVPIATTTASTTHQYALKK